VVVVTYMAIALVERRRLRATGRTVEWSSLAPFSAEGYLVVSSGLNSSGRLWWLTKDGYDRTLAELRSNWDMGGEITDEDVAEHSLRDTAFLVLHGPKPDQVRDTGRAKVIRVENESIEEYEE
jgi:hypothetical protein